jgi:hypothetical protein
MIDSNLVIYNGKIKLTEKKVYDKIDVFSYFIIIIV